ncbi:SdpI/YhfL family protein [Rhodococcus sp. OK519]|uniref:SdpI family protein n=1 Tax=Rhodococcus sp. OK519 TaxID=2135729 RepID=UPI000D338AEE|nr:SdpI/YhfL family protein [Rhodococcus sp. OK519]
MDGIGLQIALCLTFVIAGVTIAWTSWAAANGRLRRNPYLGIRTPTVMFSDETWATAHRASRAWTGIGGAASVVTGLAVLVPMSEAAHTALAGVGAACLLGFTLIGARVGVQAARDVISAGDHPVDSNTSSN